MATDRDQHARMLRRIATARAKSHPLSQTHLSAFSCPSCGIAVAAKGFTFVSPSFRLLGATCPGCERRVLITADRWQRLSERLTVTADTEPDLS